MIALMRQLLGLAAAGLVLTGCAPAPAARAPQVDRDEIGLRLSSDIAVLAADDMRGRKPGTPGGRAAYTYIEKRMEEVGLVSGTNDPGSYWRLPVDLLATEPQTAQLVLTQGKRRVVIPATDAAAYTLRRRALAFGGPGTGVPVVFVGYGDGSVLGEALAGAVAVMLADPGRDADRRDALFRQRATAVVTVLPDRESLTRVRALQERAHVQLANEESDTLAAYVTDSVLADMIGARRWEGLKREAEAGTLPPYELNLAISIEATSDRREYPSQNILGMIPGTAPGMGAVLVLAHWDHLGECGPAAASDHICNGAADNASGVAMMLELARRLKQGPPLARDIYFLATTAEEPGLLGTRAFVKDPPLPLGSIVAAFNLDMMAVAPKGSPVGFIGRGFDAALDAAVLDAIAASGRAVGDQALADSFVQRQDGWALVQAGVPTVLVSGTYGSRAVLDPFIAARYHQPGDEADAVELGGAIEDTLLHEALIRRIADPARYPATDRSGPKTRP